MMIAAIHARKSRALETSRWAEGRREMSKDRVATAKRNLQAALDAAQADFTATVQFTTDGYDVTFKRGSLTWSVSRVPLEVLEDEDSPKLEALVEEARRQLDRQEDKA